MKKVHYDDGRYVLYEDEAQLLNGDTKIQQRFKRPDSAHIIALPHSESILLLREYRPFWKEHVWMLPSGNVDKESDPLEGAMRELREETGYAAKEMNFYFNSHHSEVTDYVSHVYIATDLYEDPLPQDDDEHIEVHTLSIQDALHKIESCKHSHALSAYAMRKYMMEHL